VSTWTMKSAIFSLCCPLCARMPLPDLTPPVCWGIWTIMHPVGAGEPRTRRHRRRTCGHVPKMSGAVVSESCVVMCLQFGLGAVRRSRLPLRAFRLSYAHLLSVWIVFDALLELSGFNRLRNFHLHLELEVRPFLFIHTIGFHRFLLGVGLDAYSPSVG
jgi:hypothetical protein